MAEKTPEELITELEEIGKTCRVAGLLVAFPKTTRLVDRRDANKLDVLTIALRGGGKAIAWYILTDDGLRLRLRPEYKGQKWAAETLRRVASTLIDESRNPPKDMSN